MVKTYRDYHEEAKEKIRKMSSEKLDKERKTYNPTYKRIAREELKARGYLKPKKVHYIPEPFGLPYELSPVGMYKRPKNKLDKDIHKELKRLLHGKI